MSGGGIVSDGPEARPRRDWTLLRCPRCDRAYMSESAEIVGTLLSVHIETCGMKEEREGND